MKPGIIAVLVCGCFIIFIVIVAICIIVNYGAFSTTSWNLLLEKNQKAIKSTIVVSCTTIPDQMKSLKRTLASILALDPAPLNIYVNIPPIFERTGQPYVIPNWLRDGPFTLLPNVKDTGPSTKYLSTLRHVDRDQPILIFDDDAMLCDQKILTFLELAGEMYPDAALTFGGKCIPEKYKKLRSYDFKRMENVYAMRTWRSYFQKHGVSQSRKSVKKKMDTLPVDIIMGHSTYLIRPRFFDLDRLSDYSAFPKEARFVDDIVISGCLAERGVPRLVVGGWPETRKEIRAVFSDLVDEVFRRKSSTALHNTVNRTSHNDDTMIAFFADSW